MTGFRPTRRFIAGAVCPRCAAMDKLVIDLESDRRECVACGFSDARPRDKADPAVRELPTLYAALVLLVVGNGFFKPNVSTMVGNLYRPGSHLRDRAYNIFYMGINIGASLSALLSAPLRNLWSFNLAFTAAGVGLLIGVVVLAALSHGSAWKSLIFAKCPNIGCLRRSCPPARSSSSATTETTATTAMPGASSLWRASRG